jgi:hypothetical protein
VKNECHIFLSIICPFSNNIVSGVICDVILCRGYIKEMKSVILSVDSIVSVFCSPK